MTEHCFICEIVFNEDDEYRTDIDGRTLCERCWTDMLDMNDESDLREYAEREDSDQEFEDTLDL